MFSVFLFVCRLCLIELRLKGTWNWKAPHENGRLVRICNLDAIALEKWFMWAILMTSFFPTQCTISHVSFLFLLSFTSVYQVFVC